jgi:integrase
MQGSRSASRARSQLTSDPPLDGVTHLSAKYIRPACERAGTRRFTPHGLRRAAVDAMMRGGVDVGTAATITGHSVQVMIKHYQQATDDDRRRAVIKAQLGTLDVGTIIAFPGSTTGG